MSVGQRDRDDSSVRVLATASQRDSGSNRAWLSQLRHIHDEAFAFDGDRHIAGLNERFGLTGDMELSVHVPGLPPVWFNGDVEAIEPNRWALVISLNPHTPPQGFYGQGHSPDAYWNLWRTHNRDRYWYKQFYRGLALVAIAALGEKVPVDQEPDFATRRMVFTELIPYASRKFELDPDRVVELVRNDRGGATMARINRLLIEYARPTLILVNGNPGIKNFAAVYSDRLRWEEVRYPSVHQPTKTLRHFQGFVQVGSRTVPVIGFPFLRKPSTHNADIEVNQLGQLVKDFLASAPE